jgi:hypothetical protein
VEASWLVIHAGMGHRPERKDPVLDELSRDEALKALHGRRVAIEPAVALLAVGVEAGGISWSGPVPRSESTDELVIGRSCRTSRDNLTSDNGATPAGAFL